MQYLLFFIDQHLWSLGRPLMQNRKESASQACWYCSRRCLSLTASHRHINDMGHHQRELLWLSMTSTSWRCLTSNTSATSIHYCSLRLPELWSSSSLLSACGGFVDQVCQICMACRWKPGFKALMSSDIRNHQEPVAANHMILWF